MLSDRLLEFSTMGAEWVLWLLVVLSVMSVAVMVDRYLFFRRTRFNLAELEPRLTLAVQQGDWDTARDVVAGDSFEGNVVLRGIEVMEQDLGQGPAEQAMLGAIARERTRYDRKLSVLGTIGNNAPFVWLFGTVLGVIEAFQELDSGSAAVEASSRPEIMGALGEALVATGVGILVAIPAVAAYNACRAHISARMRNAEALMRSLLVGCTEPKGDS